MTSSISWIDRDSLEATLARIGVRGRRPPARVVHRVPDVLPSDRPRPFAPTEPGTGSARVAQNRPVARVRHVEETRAVVVEGVQAVEQAPAEAIQGELIPEFLPPHGPLRRRLEAFINWLVARSGSAVAFIIDRDGLPLADRHADPDLLAIASSVMRVVESVNNRLLFHVGRAVTLELEEGQLMLISVETPIGRYIVGQVGDRPLGRDLRRAVTDGLRRAFQPDPEQGAAGF